MWSIPAALAAREYRGLLDTLTQDRRVLIKPWNIGDRTQREPPGYNYINFRMKCQNAG